MDTNILTQNLGLSDKEAAVYIAILELGESTVNPIAQQSGIKRTSIYYFIDHLVELGLIEVAVIRNRKHFKARSPEYLSVLQQRRLQEVQDAMPQFMSLFNVSTNKPRISYFEGPEQVRQIMWEELRHKEIRFIWPLKEVVEMIGGSNFMAKLIRQLREKQVHVKTLRFPDQEVAYEGSVNTPRETWREIRYVKPGITFPMAIGIYDQDTVAFISSKKEGYGILIESAELGAAMIYLFEMFWSQAKPQPKSS
ncbi:MAG: helix-turn-helix domain-containing protein [bacterium]|nr:helix-turn-helix domain-containing protein [bacterium]